jgi:hypothetical protein
VPLAALLLGMFRQRHTFLIAVVTIVGLCSGPDRAALCERYLCHLRGIAPPDARPPDPDG